jgi:hypothetical protein
MKLAETIIDLVRNLAHQRESLPNHIYLRSIRNRQDHSPKLKIIRKRIAPETNLFNDDGDPIEFAIENSGGIIRQFISILHKAAMSVGRHQGINISLYDVEEGASSFGQTLEKHLQNLEKRITAKSILPAVASGE